MKFLRLVASNLKRKKIRTLLTLLSILVAFVLFAYLAAIRQGLSQGVDVAGADRLVVRHKVSIIQFLPESYEADMEQIEGVAEATHATWFGGIYQEPKNFFAQFPVKPEEYLEMYPEFLLPEDQKRAWFRTRTGAVAGRTLAERFGWKVGDKIPIQATIFTRSGGQGTWEFDLVGIYDGAEPGTDTSQFLFGHDYFDEARDFGRGQIGWYYVRVEDPANAASVAAAIDAEFANSPAETKAETEGAFVQGFADQIGNIGAIIQAIVGAVFFTILLVAGNTMAQSVRERTGELAVLKAVGFSDHHVLGLVLAEAMAIAAVGGFVGLALGWFMISAGDPTGGLLPIFYLPRKDILIGVALVAVLGLSTGLVPALQASRLRIADALRRL
jgi:putative ABC transport system permease protein